MIHTIQKQIVAESFKSLRSHRIHALFAGYLCLQQQAGRLGRLEDLQPDFVSFFERFFRVEHHPIGTPYLKPFTDVKPSIKNLWLNENVAGSYAPSSLRPDQPFRKVVDVVVNKKYSKYSLFKNHAQLVREHLLHGEKIPLADLAIFLYRDFGLIGNSPKVSDLIDVFAVDFGYATKSGAPRNEDFHMIYSLESTNQQDKDWLETWQSEDANSKSSRSAIHPNLTTHRIRNLTSEDVLATETNLNRSQPHLQELRINGLLSFGTETVFEFGRLNVLVGPNGSGKSNLIDCLRAFRDAPLDIQQAFVNGGFESWLYNGLDKQSGSGVLQVIVWVTGLANAVRHEIRLGPPSHSRAQLEELVSNATVDSKETAPYFVGSYRSPAILGFSGAGKRRHKQLATDDYNPFRSILSQVRDVDQYPEITRLAKLYSSYRIYSEWSFGRNSKLRESAPTGRSDAKLSESMNDLPVALNALEQTPAHERILKLLPELKETYVDYVTRLLFGRVGLELVESPFKLPVPAIRLSDGTLRFLALAAILLQPDPPPLICLEEPELGMHPDMIRMVAGMIIEASAKTQLIISTHSEHMLTALQNNFDALFTFDAGPKGTVVQRLSRQDFHKWRAEHALGELWSSGELGGVRY
jgi:predicted ATPase